MYGKIEITDEVLKEKFNYKRKLRKLLIGLIPFIIVFFVVGFFIVNAIISLMFNLFLPLLVALAIVCIIFYFNFVLPLGNLIKDNRRIKTGNFIIVDDILMLKETERVFRDNAKNTTNYLFAFEHFPRKTDMNRFEIKSSNMIKKPNFTKVSEDEYIKGEQGDKYFLLIVENGDRISCMFNHKYYYINPLRVFGKRKADNIEM